MNEKFKIAAYAMKIKLKIFLTFFLLLFLLFIGCKNEKIKTIKPDVQADNPARIVYFMAGDIEPNETGILNINAFIPENMLARVQNGMEVIIRVSGYDSNLFQGIISKINSDIDLKSKTALVEIKILDLNPILKAGMIVMIELEEKSKI